MLGHQAAALLVLERSDVRILNKVRAAILEPEGNQSADSVR
jgi:hypothetical protein